MAILAVVGSIVAGSVGAAVGGCGAYLGSKALDDRSSHAAARGVARVLQSQLASAGIRFKWAIKNRRYVDPADPALRIQLGIGDQKLIASSTSAEEWASVASSLASLQLANALLSYPVPPNAPATDEVIASYVGTVRALDDADRALTSLTGISNSDTYYR